MRRALRSLLALIALTSLPRTAAAVSSAELYTLNSYRYGRFEARIRYAPGEGVVSSFFLWKDGSEVANTFWNELDFEKLNGDCRMQTNALYGTPVNSSERIHTMPPDMCEAYHDYGFEWTPTYIAWLIDGMEIRRETGAVATAFADNAPNGMQIRFNVWPGNANFGGNFDPAILPVHQYISWVQYSSYQDGEFHVEWREEFNGAALPNGWATGSWPSPYELSTHNPQNVNFVNGIAVLSLTSDQAPGFTGMPPADGGAGAPSGGASGSGGASTAGTSAGGTNTGGTSTGGTSTGGVSPSGAGGTIAGSGGTAGIENSAGTGNGGDAASAGTTSTTGGNTGAPAGGTAPTTGGSTGAPSGGSASTTGGSTGAPAGGSAPTTGNAGNANTNASPAGDDGGCGCGVAAPQQTRLSVIGAALLALAALRRRRAR